MTFNKGDQVAYIPMHAEGDITHEDVEHGTVSSQNDLYVFVLFESQHHTAAAQSCRPEDLRKI
tara:strand:+ start:14679 stop:14867 length:189 start_codon:yes stop_codon:yes gene_type:complete